MDKPTLTKRECAALKWVDSYSPPGKAPITSTPSGVGPKCLAGLEARGLAVSVAGMYWSATNAGRAALKEAQADEHPKTDLATA